MGRSVNSEVIMMGRAVVRQEVNYRGVTQSWHDF